MRAAREPCEYFFICMQNFQEEFNRFIYKRATFRSLSILAIYMYVAIKLSLNYYYELHGEMIFLFLFMGFCFGILLFVRFMIVNAYTEPVEVRQKAAYLVSGFASIRLFLVKLIRSRASPKYVSRNVRGVPSQQYKSA